MAWSFNQNSSVVVLKQLDHHSQKSSLGHHPYITRDDDHGDVDDDHGAKTVLASVYSLHQLSCSSSAVVVPEYFGNHP
eukprot:871835-Karenia_brevis.AAC.1